RQSFLAGAEGAMRDLLKDLPGLTVEVRKQIWAKGEQARLRLKQTQRKCFIDDPFRYESWGRGLDTDRATRASTEYALTYFAAIADEYTRLRTSYEELGELLTNAIRFVDAQTVACWRRLDFDHRM